MISKILPVCLIILSSGCSLIGGKPYVPETKAVEVVTVTKQAVVYHPPMPNPIMTKPVEWKVLTPDTMGEYLEDLEKGEAPVNVFYGVSPTGYENLSVNMSEIKRYLRQMFSIITYYKELNDGQDEEKAD